MAMAAAARKMPVLVAHMPSPVSTRDSNPVSARDSNQCAAAAHAQEHATAGSRCAHTKSCVGTGQHRRAAAVHAPDRRQWMRSSALWTRTRRSRGRAADVGQARIALGAGGRLCVCIGQAAGGRLRVCIGQATVHVLGKRRGVRASGSGNSGGQPPRMRRTSQRPSGSSSVLVARAKSCIDPRRTRQVPRRGSTAIGAPPPHTHGIGDSGRARCARRRARAHAGMRTRARGGQRAEGVGGVQKARRQTAQGARGACRGREGRRAAGGRLCPWPFGICLWAAAVPRDEQEAKKGGDVDVMAGKAGHEKWAKKETKMTTLSITIVMVVVVTLAEMATKVAEEGTQVEEAVVMAAAAAAMAEVGASHLIWPGYNNNNTSESGGGYGQY
ncbi:hypothetical protein GGX14DRAFT_400423 [Mycena pura]|uniref:Uncharacterized protein n=1 Tax=Mycena pura TaxID=153505 RepID=A0AAD6V2V6_9AGAR|nr:hypothetical protein GGX14DRAFT_400423 [Mycena pura]